MEWSSVDEVLARLMALALGSPLIMLASIAVCLVTTYSLNPLARWRFRHLPGPTPRPFIGNLDELRRVHHWEAIAKWVRQYGKILRYFDGRIPTVVVADPELAKELLLTRFKLFHNREVPTFIPYAIPKAYPRISQNMVWAKDKDWASVRSAVSPFFHTSQLRSYASDMNRSVGRLKSLLSHHAESGEAADVRQYFGGFALEVVGTSAFGVDFDTQTRASNEQDELVAGVTAMFNTSPLVGAVAFLINCLPWLAPALGLLLRSLSSLSKAAQRQVEMRKLTVVTSYILLKNAEQRFTGSKASLPAQEVDLPWGEFRFNPQESKYKDVVPTEGSLPDLLMHGKHKLTGEPLSEMQMTAQQHVFLLAGYDTTANCLSYCLYLLAKHLEEQEKVIKEVDAFKWDGELAHDDLDSFPYTRAVVDEALRLFPPAPGTVRVAEKDTTLGGHFVPAGTVVRVDIYGMHRDPELFPDPEVFRPSRFLKDSDEAKARHPYAYLPFGAGPRMCIGYKFALQEIMLALATLVRSFRFSPDPAHDQAVLRTKGLITMSPAEGVWVKVESRGVTCTSK